MNGEAPPYDSPQLLAVAAYITWLSYGQPIGKSPEWRGQNVIAQESLIPIEQLDPVPGRELYTRHCTMWHGADGQGVEMVGVKPGALWGRAPGTTVPVRRESTLSPDTFGMPCRSRSRASSVTRRRSMSRPTSTQERPSYPGKAEDYPAGAPVDAVYYPRYPENPLRAKLQGTSTTGFRRF
jgi:hypothetical protein